AKAGAADSARFLAGHTEWFLRLGTPGGYSPERLLSRLAPTLSSPRASVEGLHLFTFNPVQQTEQWRPALPARLGEGAGRAGRRAGGARARGKRMYAMGCTGLLWVRPQIPPVR